MGKVNFEDMTVEELVKLSEETISGFKHLDSRADVYRKALDKYEGDEQVKERLQREWFAFLLKPCDTGKRRFEPRYSILNEHGKVHHLPDLAKDFTKEAIDYYRQRVEETENPVLKARYADIIWDFAKDHHIVSTAVGAYLNVGTHYVFHESGEWDREAYKAFKRGMKLAWQLNKKESLDESLAAVNAALETLSEANRFRYCLDLSQLFLECISKLKAKIDLGRLRSITEKAVSHYEEYPDKFHLQRMFLELLVRIDQERKDSDSVMNDQLRLAELFIRHAETRIADGVASHFYEKALNVFYTLGSFPDRIEEIKVKIQKSNREASGKMIPISETIEIPREEIDKYLACYDEPQDADHFLRRMASDQNLLPSWIEALKFTKEMQDEFLLQNLFSTSLMKGDIKVKEITEGSEKIEYQTIRHLQLKYQIMSNICLTKIFEKFKNRFDHYHEELVSYLGRTSVISANRLMILDAGIERFFEQDYISCVHIFVFQIEGILRDMVGLLGLPTYSNDQKTHESRVRTLPDLLDELGNRGVDKNLLKLMSVFLNDIAGDNLRNDVAHGISGVQILNQINAQLLLYILLKLCVYEIDEVQE